MSIDKETADTDIEESPTARSFPKVLEEQSDERTGWSLKIWEDGTIMVR